ncbi:MAG: phosphoribosyltransferase [Ignavibacteriota bacterium]
MAPINIETVQSDIDTYLDGVLPNVDLVIGVLRYGAHLPHLWRNANRLKDHLPLVLSHMVDFLPKGVLHNKTVLVLDDTVYRGRQMRDNVERLEALGVPPDKIRSAAVVIHEDSQFLPTFRPRRVCEEEEYIAWKTAFSGLVRSQRRSIDRDHPLYFFNIRNARAGTILSVLENFGFVSAAGEAGNERIFSYAATIQSRLLSNRLKQPLHTNSVPGLVLSDVCKVRLYWEMSESGIDLTIVPMVFATLDFSLFLSSDAERVFHELTGVPLKDLEYLSATPKAWQRFVFFLITRSIAAGLVLQFVEDFAIQLRTKGADIQSIDPDLQDQPVRNVFPPAYERFHEMIRQRILEVLQHQPASPTIPFPWPTPVSTSGSSETLKCVRIGMPDKFAILAALTRKHPAAFFDGRRWLPTENTDGALTFEQLRTEMSSPVALSVALDELLDAVCCERRMRLYLAMVHGMAVFICLAASTTRFRLAASFRIGTLNSRQPVACPRS